MIVRAALRLHPEDNVALALRPLDAGSKAEGTRLREAIPAGHKFALTDIAAGQPVFKYGSQIAVATRPIARGSHVHVHNAGMPPGGIARNITGGAWRPPRCSEQRNFLGIRRPDGRVGTRNYVGILTTVNCSATAARLIADNFRHEAGTNWPNVDGVIALTHNHGCAMGRDSEGLATLRRTLAGYARHPNFGGVLLLGLGCESNELELVLEACGGLGEQIRAIDVQSTGGTRAVVSEGTEIIRDLLENADANERVPCPLSHLKLGLQCGGSDAFSGITANPALGAAVDLLVAHGGTAILSETPEIYGAEHLLKVRTADGVVGAALDDLIDWWRRHAQQYGGTLNDNPSAGNMAGGITTILEKSLGAVVKGGSSPLAGVYRYAEPVEEQGLVFMDSPGFDPASATGQVASGANVIAFTTGRGSTFGCKPVPSMKLATNSAMFARLRDDMDINCGDIADGKASVADKGREIFEALIEMASGKQSASERLGFGEAEFVPWVPGAVT